MAARELGIGDVPLMCTQELDIDGAMPRVVRVMAHVETDPPARRGHARLPARGGARCAGTWRSDPAAAGVHVRRSSAPACSARASGWPCPGPVRSASAGTTRRRRAVRAGPRPRRRGLAAEATAAPAVVVVAAPPDAVAAVVARELAAWPEAVVTDVASVKLAVLDEVSALGGDLRRYVGSHPHGRTGAVRRDRGAGRPVRGAPLGGGTRPPRPARRPLAAVRELALAVGAAPTRMTPDDHDAAVAAVSHVPQVAASLVAARLRDLPDSAVALAGQGLRDVTRIAASDPSCGPRSWPRTPLPCGSCSSSSLPTWTTSCRPCGAGRRLRRLRGSGGRRRPRECGPRVASRPGPCGGQRQRRPRPHPGQARCRADGVRHGDGAGAGPSRARWPGCCTTSARPGSTSRTCTSSTASGRRSAWPSSRCCRRPPSR